MNTGQEVNEYGDNSSNMKLHAARIGALPEGMNRFSQFNKLLKDPRYVNLEKPDQQDLRKVATVAAKNRSLWNTRRLGKLGGRSRRRRRHSNKRRRTRRH